MLVKNRDMKKQTKRTLFVLGGFGLLYWLTKSKNSSTTPPPPPDQGAAEAQEIITETQAAVASPYRDATV